MPKSDNKSNHSHGHSHMGMMLMCVVLMGGAYLFFSSGELGEGLSLATLAPLLLCVGAHFLMHRSMGHGDQHSAHTHEQEAQKTHPETEKKQLTLHRPSRRI